MTYYIRIDDAKDFVWLQNLITNSLKSPNTTVLQAAYGHLWNWDKYLKNPIPAKDVASSVQDAGEILTSAHYKIHTIKPVASKPKAKEQKVKRKYVRKNGPTFVADPVVNDPYSCPDHLNRTGAQAPRDGCEVCWQIFKALHPQTYQAKRLAFEQKQRSHALF